ncbi:MAG TPA: chemotaxis protein CheX [Calditrichia bacterium]|nr:chemotaxis protein CheX [Calditrichota bacterium]HQU70813.1 chemotaxis protein CheX [Calditrichia bacterium]HQV31177.1 chemotaxis protein CheX [Calditrichia bacterium]
MTETDLHFFIDSTMSYFEETTGEAAQPGIPFLKGRDPLVRDFSGIIGISGQRKGCIYITASRALLNQLAQCILNRPTISREEMKDLAGEIANTIAGNVREAYGSTFMISVPVVVEGRAKDIVVPQEPPAFVIPFTWRDCEASLVLSLTP